MKESVKNAAALLCQQKPELQKQPQASTPPQIQEFPTVSYSRGGKFKDCFETPPYSLSPMRKCLLYSLSLHFM